MMKEFQLNGSRHITNTIRDALRGGKTTATITGDWEIEEAIRLPGGFTLILDGCHLKMADGVYANMFVNEHHDTEIGRTPAGTDRFITLLGKNGAILDGGTYNGLSEKNQLTEGLPPIWKNNLILFTNVRHFEIAGLSLRNQRWWAMNFVYCAKGKLHDLDFCASDIAMDENGGEYHGLKRDAYNDVLVKNADGIDLRQGCHDILIEDITGFTEDDSIALTALDGRLEQAFKVAGLLPDLCDITVKNICTSAFCTNVRLLNQGGIKLHDILIDGVYDTSAASPYMDRGLYGVRVGDTRLYGERHSTEKETYNITVKNIRSRGKCAALGLAGAIKNLITENIEAFDGTPLLEDKR